MTFSPSHFGMGGSLFSLYSFSNSSRDTGKVDKFEKWFVGLGIVEVLTVYNAGESCGERWTTGGKNFFASGQRNPLHRLFTKLSPSHLLKNVRFSPRNPQVFHKEAL